ncbi:MAG: hypothetical protein RIK87_10660 [Fuerstiella sp.]
MSEVRLVIRDANEDRSGTIHGAEADWFIAALSADPVSISELDAAVDRFALESPEQGHLSFFCRTLNAEPWDAGLIVIDMAARLVVIDSSYSALGHEGVINRHGVRSVEDESVCLYYHLADDWLFLYDATDWEKTACVRRQQRIEQPVTDLREIFYGAPMLRFIIDGCMRQFSHRDEIFERVRRKWIKSRRHWNECYAQEPQPAPETMTMHELARVEDPTEDIEYRIYYDTIRDIHADWLMTPCAELNGQLPRAVMLQDHRRLSNDMTDRERQWNTVNRCPPGISPESHAFQFSGFNTNEIVMYYDYVREVAWACWDRLRMISDAEFKTLQASQHELDVFVRDEVIRLREVGEQWMDAPWDDDPARTPRGIINLERRRQPDGGQFHPIDPDCPCCQALAEMPGIGFWHMDGCNMDDLFAFAYDHETIESWKQEQADFREFSEQMEQQHRLAREWCLPPEYSEPPPDADDVWRLVVRTAAGEIPLGRRLNRVAHAAVFLTVRLRIASTHDIGFAVAEYIESLQLGYTQLRRACEDSTDRELSRDIEANVGRLLDVVDRLTTHLARCLGVSEDDESEEDTGEEDSGDVDSGDVLQRKFHWQRLLHGGKELRHLVRTFTALQKENAYDDWYPGDVPF